MKLKKKTVKHLDRWANLSMFTFSAGSICLVGLGYPIVGAASGLLSEPAYAWMSYRAKSWALWALTGWWTIWWAKILWENL